MLHGRTVPRQSTSNLSQTLEAKFGILRTDKQECGVRLTINIIDKEEKQREVVHDRQYSCLQTKSNDPYVVKHTSDQVEYDGHYQICLEVVDIRTPSLLIELFMGEKLNPVLYHN